jgi:hypothetical protein
MGRGEGYSGLGYITQKAASSAARSPRTMARSDTQAVAELGLGPDDGIFFAAGKEAQAAKLGRPRPDPRRRTARPHRREPLRFLLDRRLSDVRI